MVLTGSSGEGDAGALRRGFCARPGWMPAHKGIWAAHHRQGRLGTRGAVLLVGWSVIQKDMGFRNHLKELDLNWALNDQET